ncbi:MAG: hypothetical protein GOP50_05690 [Candidatus Heimdallarchaeota archaeon]|nr:hypothetical protein [Candidatus Heimdallarchaeota archaeon]
MKWLYQKGIITAIILLILSTNGIYALNESMIIESDFAFFEYRQIPLDKGSSYVDMTIDVLNSEIDNCSVYVIDSKQLFELAAIWHYILPNPIGLGKRIQPWADPNLLVPDNDFYYANISGTVTYFELDHPEVEILLDAASYYIKASELESITVYFGASNLTEGETRVVSGYIGPLTYDNIVTNTTVSTLGNITTTIYDYTTSTYDLDYFIVVDSFIAYFSPNILDPMHPYIEGIDAFYVKVHIKFVTTLPAPSALVAIVVLSTISFVIYKRRKKN